MLQTVLSYPPTAGPLEEELVPAPPAPASALLKQLGAAPPWALAQALVAAAVVAAPAASCPPMAGSEHQAVVAAAVAAAGSAPPWGVFALAAMTVMAALAA